MVSQLRPRDSPKSLGSQPRNLEKKGIGPERIIHPSQSNSGKTEVAYNVVSTEAYVNPEQQEPNRLLPVSECNPSVEISSTLQHMKRQLFPDDTSDKLQNRQNSLNTGRAMPSPQTDPHLHNRAIMSSSSSISLKYSNWSTTRSKMLGFGTSSTFGINLKLRVDKKNQTVRDERKASFTLKVLPTNIDKDSSKDIERTSYRSICLGKEGKINLQIQHEDKIISVIPKDIIWNNEQQQSVPITQPTEIIPMGMISRRVVGIKRKDISNSGNTPSQKKRLSWGASGSKGDKQLSNIASKLEEARIIKMKREINKGSRLSILEISQHESQQYNVDHDRVPVSRSHRAPDSLISIPPSNL
jgi:hypothetical protein